MFDAIAGIKSRRAKIVDALLHNDKENITYHTLTLQSLLNLFYNRDWISEDVFDEQYDFTERVLGAVRDEV